MCDTRGVCSGRLREQARSRQLTEFFQTRTAISRGSELARDGRTSSLTALALQPLHHPQPRRSPTGETRGQQIAARRRFPIQHFPRAEHARQLLEHQTLIHRFEHHATGTADGLVQWAGFHQRQWQRFDRFGQQRRISEAFGRSEFAQQTPLSRHRCRAGCAGVSTWSVNRAVCSAQPELYPQACPATGRGEWLPSRAD